MKKLFKILGIALAIILLIGIIGSAGEPSENKTQEKAEEVSQEIEEKEEFTKEDALKKIQEYKITVDLKSPDIPKGTTILEAYEIKGRVPAVENFGWFAEDTDEKGKYIVGYRQTVSENLPQEPRWEVTKDTIKALNGKAITITPEFGPQLKEVQGNELEKQVYETVSGLFKKYTDEVFSKNNEPTSEQLDEAEKRAVEETAAKYKITEEEVKEIFSRLDKSRYSQ